METVSLEEILQAGFDSYTGYPSAISHHVVVPREFAQAVWFRLDKQDQAKRRECKPC